MRYMEIPIQTENSESYARLETYILDTPVEKIAIKKRPVVVICPGGGYEKLSFREGEPIAVHFLNQGYHACVLRYSVAPARFPTALLELGTVMKLLHEHAEEWGIDTDKIVLSGFSAGAHLAASLGVFYEKQWLLEKLETTFRVLKPMGMVLSYPVISSEDGIGHLASFRNLLGDRFEELREKLSIEKQVNGHTPPVFLWHTLEDRTVPVENSFVLVSALKKAGVSAELHVFPKGEHGMSLASESVRRTDGTGVQAECQKWIELADIWLKKLFEK